MPYLLIAKLAGGALIVVMVLGGITTFYLHYEHLQSEAAKVPVLEQRVADYAKADIDRQKVDAALSTWQNAKTDILTTIRKGMAHAPIAVNPVCAPSDDDRRVRNEALARVLPDAAGASHGTDAKPGL